MTSYKNEIKKLADTTVLTNRQIANAVGCNVKTVNKYAGSFVKRLQRKAKLDEKSWQVKKSVLLPDIHYPHYEERVMNVVNEFIMDYQPDEIVYLGDQLSLDCISSWNRRKPLLKEGQRLQYDYDCFNKNVLIKHESITKKDTKRVFMVGNHEARIDMYCEEHPEVKGMIDIISYLKLEERGYKIISFNEIYKIGKLNAIHGFYWNKYHSSKTLEAFGGNVVYGHVHNPQMYCKISPIDRKEYHMATSLPCLCNIKPDYKKNAPNFWVNGFGIVESIPATGYYNLYTIIINDGKFMFNGKLYGSPLCKSKE